MEGGPLEIAFSSQIRPNFFRSWLALGLLLGASWEPPGGILGRLGCLLGRLGGILGRLGSLLVRLGRVLGASWGLFWTHFGFETIFNGFWLRKVIPKTFQIIEFSLVFQGFFDFRRFQHKYGF